MTVFDKIETSLSRTSGGHLTAELAETLRLAAPMVAQQLGQIAMMTTDLAFIGRLGGEALAAAALAAGLWRRRCAAGQAGAARRPLGGAPDRAADHGVPTARRADPARPRPG